MSTNVLPPRPGTGAAYLYYWRLAYADGSIFDESIEGRSIIDSPEDAIELYVMKKGRATPLWRVPIPPGGRPLWYRKRSIDVRVGDPKPNGGATPASRIRTDATIFGYVQDRGNEIGGQCWMLANDLTYRVPDEYVDKGAVERCFLRGR